MLAAELDAGDRVRVHIQTGPITAAILAVVVDVPERAWVIFWSMTLHQPFVLFVLARVACSAAEALISVPRPSCAALAVGGAGG